MVYLRDNEINFLSNNTIIPLISIIRLSVTFIDYSYKFSIELLMISLLVYQTEVIRLQISMMILVRLFNFFFILSDISLQRVLKGKSNNHIGGVHIDNNTKCD